MTDVMKDERTIMVENASYRWGYTILVFGVLLDGVIRGMVKRGAIPDPLSIFASNWDLLGLVFVSSAAATVYQMVHGTLGHIRLRRFALSMGLAALGAAILGFFMNYSQGG